MNLASSWIENDKKFQALSGFIGLFSFRSNVRRAKNGQIIEACFLSHFAERGSSFFFSYETHNNTPRTPICHSTNCSAQRRITNQPECCTAYRKRKFRLCKAAAEVASPRSARCYVTPPMNR